MQAPEGSPLGFECIPLLIRRDRTRQLVLSSPWYASFGRAGGFPPLAETVEPILALTAGGVDLAGGAEYYSTDDQPGRVLRVNKSSQAPPPR